MAKTRSIEERIEDWCKKQFDGQKYYTKTDFINSEIESALEKAPSKQGGSGKNYPDIKYLLTVENCRRIPVMIEVKGKKGCLIKVNDKGEVDNTKKDLEPNYRRTRQTLWRAVQMLTQKLCCQTIHDCPKVVPLHYESE